MDFPDPPDKDEMEEIRKEIEKEYEEWDPLDLPESQERLAKDLKAAGAPDEMISKVGAGAYHDYVSPHPMPKHLLVNEAKSHDLYEIAKKAKNGEYDP